MSWFDAELLHLWLIEPEIDKSTAEGDLGAELLVDHLEERTQRQPVTTRHLGHRHHPRVGRDRDHVIFFTDPSIELLDEPTDAGILLSECLSRLETLGAPSVPSIVRRLHSHIHERGDVISIDRLPVHH